MPFDVMDAQERLPVRQGQGAGEADELFLSGGESAAALAHARQLLAEGADVIDVGGESTRPGARAPPLSRRRAR